MLTDLWAVLSLLYLPNLVAFKCKILYNNYATSHRKYLPQLDLSFIIRTTQ